MRPATTLGDAIEQTASALAGAGLCFAHGTDNPDDEAALLVLGGLGLPLDPSRADPSRPLSAKERRALAALVGRRVRERIPAAYLVGRTLFAGLEFRADSRALVPRSPIAELIGDHFAPWLDADRVDRLLDMCTGGGCIAVASAVEFPWVRVDAADLSADALALAAENVRLHGVGDRVRLVRSDLFDDLGAERYDLILANPPYVGREEYDSLPAEHGHEPGPGLLAGRDGLAVALRLLAGAPAHLREGGRLIGEVGYSRQALEALLPDIAFVWLEFEHGGEGVFLLEGDALDAAARAARHALDEE